ncbi:MAG: hypothetical protein IKJ86_02695 [Clostridia bacterium]|nr:hypothetical protein [Clostridia bacterium]
MNNKKTGLEGFLSVLVSVSLVVVTLVFSGELVTALSSFTLGSFSVMSGVAEFKAENEKFNLSKGDNYNVIGFGNGLETNIMVLIPERPKISRKLWMKRYPLMRHLQKQGILTKHNLEQQAVIQFIKM